MPYQQQSGQYNHTQWFLTLNEQAFLMSHRTLPNRQLFALFNEQFGCNMTYSRMRHFIAQYDLKKCDRGEKYTEAEKEYVRQNHESMSDKHIGQALNRTEKSILKLRRDVLKLHRSPEATKRLRTFRSQSGAKSYHARIKKGELEHPAIALHDSYIAGQLKRGTDLTAIPNELIQLQRAKIILQRELKKIAKQ